ncbi:MAG: bifunctional DNA-formamidopyrimidine glycosylase/DNA-(apurinic or apyrimidinic site) lyase [Proteobacteria bacterium]|nr:bifunctional DNA-formamidopyrimidine glycosylase/DNA-(apurinic or apyrimidinic site) lyase [Pseudomonadota bacterium]
MPELPEVETTLRGLTPYLLHQKITQVQIRAPKLRAPTPPAKPLINLTVTKLERRAKYILAHLSNGTTLLIHLGMSGRLTILPAAHATPPGKHDHIILTTPKGTITLNDARRFGLFLHLKEGALTTHPLLTALGPEPLGPQFTASYLHTQLRTRKTPIKVALMDSHLVVGVGNIYASESLFRAHIHPQTPAHKLTLKQCQTLVTCIHQTLTEAIAAGGSSLRDFAHSNGQLGYFQHSFHAYGRTGKPCLTCATPIQKITQAQRSTFFCPHCQKNEEGGCLTAPPSRNTQCAKCARSKNCP